LIFLFWKKVAKKRLGYVSLAIFCSFLHNFSHILDLWFHHVREKSITRLFSLFSQMRLLKMVRFCLTYLLFHVYFSNQFIHETYLVG
jgi:hypothetical protein